MKEQTKIKETTILKTILTAFVLAFVFMLTACGTPVAKFTVSFETNGGSSIEAIEVVNGEKITKPIDPTKSGYTFGDWYKESELNTKWNFTTDKVEADTKLYASWDITLEKAQELKINEINALLGEYNEDDYNENNWFVIKGIISVAIDDVNELESVTEVEAFDLGEVSNALTEVLTILPKLSVDKTNLEVFTSDLETENESGTLSGFEPEDKPSFDVTLTMGTDTESYEGDENKVIWVIEIDAESEGDIQLIAQDTSGNWFNVATTGFWGPVSGFNLYASTNTIYVVASGAGSYTVTLKLKYVNALEGDSIIEFTDTIEVLEAESSEG